MAFDILETSVNSSSKVLVFEFLIGTTFHRFTNASSNFSFGGNTFKAIPIDVSEIISSGDVNKKTVIITMHLGEEFTTNAINARSSSLTTVTITEVQLSDLTFNIVFKGRVLAYKFSNAEVKIPCESIYTAILRGTINRDYGPNCSYNLYDSNTCKVNPTTFKLAGTIAGVSGVDLTVVAAGTQADGWFTGGYLLFSVAGDFTNSLMIVDHVGTTITVEYPVSFLVIGLAIDMFPGCDRRATTCSTKFSNIINFPGFTYHPLINPFGGTKVF